MLLLIGFGLGCLTTLFLITARDLFRYVEAKLFLLLLFCSALFLVTPLIHPDYHGLIWNITTATPAIFWCMCQVAFARKPQLVSFWSLLALYSFIAPAVTRFLGLNEPHFKLPSLIGWEIPQYTEYLLVAHGLWAIISTWSDDLVASRRRLRGVMLAVIGFAVFGVTFSLNTSLASNTSLPLMVSIASLTCTWFLLKGRAVLLPLPIPEEKKQHSEYSEGCQKLRKLMDDGFYCTEYLTLKKLSEQLSLPEHKTRELINQELGYRNFNDYINKLRIADAQVRLLDDIDTPVLNIALDVGYRNISSFNRAFKDITQLTPTEYRKKFQAQLEFAEAQVN